MPAHTQWKKCTTIHGDMPLPVLRPVLTIRLSYRSAVAVSSRQPDCVLFSTRPSSRYRSPPLIVEIAPPVSPRLVASPRLPYRWAWSCVGRDGGRDSGRGANAIDGMRRKNRFEFLVIADKLSKTPLLRRMRGQHIFHTVSASMQASIPFLQSIPLDFDSVRLAVGVCDGD